MPTPYLHVLSTPHALTLVVAASIARLPLPMVGVHTTSGVVTAFARAAVGSLAFAAQRRTGPPPSGHEHRRGPAAVRSRGLRVLFAVGLAVVVVLGQAQLHVPAERAATPALAARP